MNAFEDSSLRCQSCGMLVGEGIYGSNRDGSAEHAYCKFCYVGGTFTEPDITIEDMVARTSTHIALERGSSPDESLELARALLPNLGRWRIS